MSIEALWNEDATEEETRAVYQELVSTGMAWKLEGSVGRAAMAMLEAGEIMLGEESHRDYYGNRIPSRHEVIPGTMGSREYVAARGGIDHG